MLVPLGFTEAISYTHDNCKYYYSPSSTGNNAAYHIDRLTKNSVSIPCHKVVTAEDVDSSLPSGMIQDPRPIMIKNYAVRDLLSRQLVEHSTTTTGLSPTGVSFISSPLPWPLQPLDRVSHLSIDYYD